MPAWVWYIIIGIFMYAVYFHIGFYFINPHWFKNSPDTITWGLSLLISGCTFLWFTTLIVFIVHKKTKKQAPEASIFTYHVQTSSIMTVWLFTSKYLCMSLVQFILSSLIIGILAIVVFTRLTIKKVK